MLKLRRAESGGAFLAPCRRIQEIFLEISVRSSSVGLSLAARSRKGEEREERRLVLSRWCFLKRDFWKQAGRSTSAAPSCGRFCPQEGKQCDVVAALHPGLWGI